MISFVRNAFAIELSSFKKLSEKARNLITSFVFSAAAYPLVSTFINAFILISKGEFINVLLYNLFRFVGLPLGFLINGYLLKKLRVNLLYFVGTILLGISAILVVIYSKVFPFYFLYGLIFGIGEGVYWANRNYLTLKETVSENRNYFAGIDNTQATVLSIIIPLLAGWFIVLGNRIGIKPYILSMITGFILLTISGLIVYRKNYKSPNVEKVILKGRNNSWRKVIFFALAIGIVESASFFFITLLILNKLGNEGVLGTITSLTAMISGIASYLYGRRSKVTHQKPIYLISIVLGLLASSLLTLGVYVGSTLIFISVFSFSTVLLWLTSGPMIMNIMDNVIGTKYSQTYSYVLDREIFLNLGRLTAVAIGMFLVLNFGQEIFLRFNMFTLYCLHLIILAFIWNKLPNIQNTSAETHY